MSNGSSQKTFVRKHLSKEIKKWFIEYDTYSDLFQIFDISVFKTDRKQLIEVKNENLRLIYKKFNKAPILLEIKGAYNLLGVDIDTLTKADIIKLVKPYIKKLEE